MEDRKDTERKSMLVLRLRIILAMGIYSIFALIFHIINFVVFFVLFPIWFLIPRMTFIRIASRYFGTFRIKKGKKYEGR